MQTMSEPLYSIVDVETTGGGISGNRITEICVVLLKGDQIIDKFVSLVNPQRTIPSFITGLTGIDDTMVREAPLFEDIADRILKMTENAIFVAHNVNFDYHVIRGEFRRLGHIFTRKKLCTVRLSRKLIPGMYSYSLGKLCSSLSIPLDNRHRAEGDTDATVMLFQRILSLDPELEILSFFLNARSKEATLPPHLDKKIVNNLPQQAGVYLFKNSKGKVIYVGKAKNIKNRVLSHFYDKKNQEYSLSQQTYTIDYELTGNELIALLLEAELIQKYYPKFNKAQKKPMAPYRILSYVNRKGIQQLVIDRSPTTDQAIEIFYNRADAVMRLEQLCFDFQLCPKYCNLQTTRERCSHYKIKNCLGVCNGKESVALYNMRVQKALNSLKKDQLNYIIKSEGRSRGEESFVMIKDGLYRGFGFISSEENRITRLEDCENYLQLRKHTYHTTKIIKGYLKKKGSQAMISFEPENNEVVSLKN